MHGVAVSGAVLAGGRSSRMGRDKAGLVVAGETLLARQLRLLAEVGIADRQVAFQPGNVRGLPPGVNAVTDRRPGLGPLAGLEACLRAAKSPLLLVLAVDLPNLTAGFLRRLLAQARPDRGVVPWRDGFAEPLVAIYPGLALNGITSRLDRGELALQPLVRSGIDAGWLAPFPLEAYDGRLLANWNSDADRIPPAA